MIEGLERETRKLKQTERAIKSKKVGQSVNQKHNTQAEQLK